MNCSEVTQWLDACIDGELDAVHGAELDRHLHGCERCARELQTRRALCEAIVGGAPVFRAPTMVRERIAASLGAGALRAGATGTLTRVASATPAPRRKGRPWLGLGLGLAASLALVATLGWSLGRSAARSAPDDFLTGELVSAHVRSLMADHLTDVLSSDHHVVRPWFNGKLDFSPPVVDLASQGFPLVGGRLDYLKERPVAALVYRHGEHPLNLFVWPGGDGAGRGDTSGGDAPSGGAAGGRPFGGDADHPLREIARDGYQILEWSGAGMTFCVVSDLNLEELRDFVRLLQRQE